MKNAIYASLSLCAALALCSCYQMPPYDELYVHGKCGKAASYLGSAVGCALDGAFFPLTVFMVDGDPVSGELGPIAAPGLASQAGFYYFGAGLCYPAHLCALPFSGLDLEGRSRQEKLALLLKALPHLDMAEYFELVKLSGRELPPDYRPADHVFEFGWRDSIDGALAGEWLAWDKAGRPAAGQEELRFVVRYWLYERKDASTWRSDPAKNLVRATYGVDDGSILAYWTECNVPLDVRDSRVWRFWIDSHAGLEKTVWRKPSKDLSL